jgi:hypothetical protein
MYGDDELNNPKRQPTDKNLGMTTPEWIGRAYLGVKNFLAVTSQSVFSFGKEVVPVFDMSRASEITEIDVVTLPRVAPATSVDACLGTVFPVIQEVCPPNEEHIYLRMSWTACSGINLGVYVTLIPPPPVPTLTAGRGLLLATALSAQPEQYLDNTVLPIYVPPGGALGYELSILSANDAYVFSYMRVRRQFGLGPLAYL